MKKSNRQTAILVVKIKTLVKPKQIVTLYLRPRYCPCKKKNSLQRVLTAAFSCQSPRYVFFLIFKILSSSIK